MLNNYICALDLGSSKITSAVAKIKRKRISNIFFESLPSKGIKRGAVVDSVELVDAISRLLKNLRAKSGIGIKFISVDISGIDMIAKHSRAIIPLAERGNKVITLSDIEKVNEQARILGSSLEEEIIHQIPLGYAIDSRSDILNPFGLYSHRLEVDLYLLCARLSSVQNLARVINQAGYEIRDLFFSGLATSKVVFDDGFKEGVNIFCDIGSDITELLIFKDGLIRDMAILNLGGDDITGELAETLKIPLDLAEEAKKSFGMIREYSEAQEDKEILIKKSNIYKPIRQKLVSEIISAKTKLIAQAIKDALDRKLGSSRAHNFIAVGRTVLLEGFLELLENTLGVPVKIARITDPEIKSWVNKDSNLSGQSYLTYITCLGMLSEALLARAPQTLSAHLPPAKNTLLRLFNRFKEVYEEYF